jgi:HD-GYP domain-containing protein (c-di-GMP phosphodiesterase class II)
MDRNVKTQPAQIHLEELLSALSQAIDMTEGQPRGHSQRCCWIGLQIARELEIDAMQSRDLYYTVLLKDLGCSSNAARICELYLADDLAIKRDAKLLDGSLPQVMRFVLQHTGLEAGLAGRLRAIHHIFKNGGAITAELFQTRCQRGSDIAKKMRFGDAVAQGIRSLDEHWDGGGKPHGLLNSDIPLFSRIALLTQVVDVFQITGGPQAAREEVQSRSGTWFDPALVNSFLKVSTQPEFFESLNSEQLGDVLPTLVPSRLSKPVDEDYLDDITAGFSDIVDSKSPYTKGHSERVALYSDMIAETLGFTKERRRWLKRAALLHDIGKLGVSNMILDKPGKLDEAEMTIMKRHAADTETILSRVSAFHRFASIAGAHHERLDGKGYPKGLKGQEIKLESRILAVADIFDALTADRPYRAAITGAKALTLMELDVGTAIDENCFGALKRALSKMDAESAPIKKTCMGSS